MLLCMLLIFAAVGAGLCRLATSRAVVAMTLSARLEGDRIEKAYGDYLRQSGINGYATDTQQITAVAFAPDPKIWEVVSANIVTPFPNDLLTTMRFSSDAESRDPGAPGTLPWSVSHAETATADASIIIQHPSIKSDTDTQRVLDIHQKIWRIPAAAVRLLVSGSQLSVTGMQIYLHGPSVYLNGNAPLGVVGSQVFTPNTNPGGETPFLNATAGANSVNAFYNLYVNPALNNLTTYIIDNEAMLPPDFCKVVIDGVTYPGLDLKNYNGMAVAIRGEWVKTGFVLVGDNSATSAKEAISIGIEGPVYLAGNNSRYAIVGTTYRTVTPCSQITWDNAASVWNIPSVGGNAAAQRWYGHLFVAQVDPRFNLREDWSSTQFSLIGSLHTIGGGMTILGAPQSTPFRLDIDNPPWPTLGNPFTPPYRYESFIYNASR